MFIGKNWKIESDSLNVILYRRHVTKPKNDKPKHEYWTAEGYYSTIANALKGLVEQKVRETALKDLRAVVNKIEELGKQIEKATKVKR